MDSADDILRFIRQHKSKNHIEIEFRLGRKNSENFDTNVGLEVYTKALKALEKYQGWETKIVKNELVYYGKRKGLRIVYNEDTEEQICVTKYPLATLDKSLLGTHDVRIAASTEIPSTYDSERDIFPVTKKRKRTSFVRKGLSIDVSEITSTGEQEDPDEESQTQYQIEFEILNPTELDDNKAYNHYNKIFDLLKCLS
jgi:hypothetical protein